MPFGSHKSQRRAFYRERIPQSSHGARKEMAVILIISKNGDRKIEQPVRITSRPHTRIKKWNRFSHFS